MSTYQPNTTDPRIRRRVIRVVSFVASMSETKPRQLSKIYLNKVFGVISNPLSKYLKEKCLITLDDLKYRFNGEETSETSNKKKSKTSHKHNFASAYYCKSYKPNLSGVNELIEMFDLTMDDFIIKTKSSAKSLNYNSSNLFLIPYGITSRPDMSDANQKILISMLQANEEFGDMLNTNEIEYKDKSGRLWGGTQSLSKATKQNLHAGYGYAYEYDIEAAAPTLLLQLAKKNGFRLRKESLVEDYIQNRSLYRRLLAVKYNLDEKEVKETINALFAGARFNSSLSKVNAKAPKFKSDEFITRLKEEIAQIWKHIKPTIGVRYKRDNTLETRISSRTKWSIYFQLERSILDVVREHLDETNNKAVLEHDGWTTTKKLDTKQLIETIKLRTGYEIKLDEKELKDISIIPIGCLSHV